jgi:dipeptidyl aminopeptidase/acylaminoacyl peptidase
MYVGSLESPETKRILPHNEVAVYSPTGHILFVRDQTLLAQPFGLKRLEVMGAPVPIASPVGSYGNRGSFSISKNGVLAYRPSYLLANSQLIWFDRKGRQLETVPAPKGSRNPEISPDGTKLAIERHDPDTGYRDIWLVELSRGVTSRFTFHAADDSDPLWSPDGKQLAFSSGREGFVNIFLKAASGAGDAEIVNKSEEIEYGYAMSWSPDGQNIITWSPTGIRILPLTGERRTVPFLQTDFVEIEPQFSPNGKWVSYTSNESGRAEIYVQSFPAGSGKWQISTGGGNDARWRPDGKEIFYIAPDRKLLAVQVNTEGEALAPSTPIPLFQTRISGVLGTGLRFNYAVSPDGERFLIATDVEGATDSPIIVVLNWPALLEQQ